MATRTGTPFRSLAFSAFLFSPPVIAPAAGLPAATRRVSASNTSEICTPSSRVGATTSATVPSPRDTPRVQAHQVGDDRERVGQRLPAARRRDDQRVPPLQQHGAGQLLDLRRAFQPQTARPLLATNLLERRADAEGGEALAVIRRLDGDGPDRRRARPRQFVGAQVERAVLRGRHPRALAARADVVWGRAGGARRGCGAASGGGGGAGLATTAPCLILSCPRFGAWRLPASRRSFFVVLGLAFVGFVPAGPRPWWRAKLSSAMAGCSRQWCALVGYRLLVAAALPRTVETSCCLSCARIIRLLRGDYGCVRAREDSVGRPRGVAERRVDNRSLASQPRPGGSAALQRGVRLCVRMFFADTSRRLEPRVAQRCCRGADIVTLGR